MMRLAVSRPLLVARCSGTKTRIVRSRTFWSSSKQKQQQQQQQRSSSATTRARDAGLEFTSVVSHPEEVEGPEDVVSRAAQLRQLTTPKIYDVLIIGGGATGAGAALDAAARGYQVACIERGDFASETSSRSTKLIWAGIKYMGTAVAAVLSPKISKSQFPQSTIFLLK